MSKLQMKKTVLLNIAALTAAVAMGNTTWYRNCNMNTANKAYLQKLQYWNNANGQAGSGDVSATDDLVLNGSISGSNPGRLRTPGITFNGNSLSIGEVYLGLRQTPRLCEMIDEEVVSRRKTIYTLKVAA